ncbi:hypothetical protein HYDPIDRAFT_114556 [Hydnomerulius pinastri MD-312]|uniref:Uncharacterized protein n=1 Tax=Hydnomerulius pinastri MD-312 TaxID=994086 RepID=A0A0C9V9S0_9AGAM|nr:hypothetical protein HYDPIDRAFT_114556 [Hydnomerulius pinastri MD-312]
MTQPNSLGCLSLSFECHSLASPELTTSSRNQLRKSTCHLPTAHIRSLTRVQVEWN